MESNNNNPKRDYLVPISILIAGVLIAAAVIYSVGVKGSDNTANKQANVAGTAVSPLVSPLKLTSGDVVLGDAKAPVTIIVYSDPSCSFCAAAEGYNQQVIDYLKKGDPSWTPPTPGIIENYVNTGKAKIVFRYYPGHGSGELAMKAMFCANEQGKFWQLKDKIFANQESVADLAKIKGFAGEVGVDVSKITECLDSGKYNLRLTMDTATGKAAGVSGTPAFFVNNTLIEGARPFKDFKTVIDQLLTSK
ncbi:MAG: putative lipoprotein [Parcubacteria group bacterium Athens0714_26]|nr:MAG: putative lipoprotein [Parcubacteria group bacterium Athens1014_26]TSD01067.1 MAG: putative lipoprotein [Parcubacteria group bacterium Athens0714_26]